MAGRPPRPKEKQDLLHEVPAHLEAVLSALKKLQARLDYDMNDGLAGSKGAGLNPNHVTMAAKLAEASTKLSRELRALTQRIKELAGAASIEERLEAIIRFSSELPDDARTGLLVAIQKQNN